MLLLFRLRWLLSVILVACLALILEPSSAGAAVSGCRGDPIVWLSNGTKLTMIASIAADPSQIKLVTYTVHAPRGLSDGRRWGRRSSR
jgi:hypothetical protein